MHCKDVSVRDVSIELNRQNIASLMSGWTAYTRAEHLILRNGNDHAVIKLIKENKLELFKKVIDFKIVSLPADTVFIDAPDADVVNIPALASVQDKFPNKTVIVRGMFSHISFVSGMESMRLNVVDSIPPSPSKLGVLVRAALSTGFIEHPIVADDVIIDMAERVKEVRTEAVMFPCRVSGLTADIPVYFLDEAPRIDHNVTLIGCDLSERIFRSLYKRDVPFINVCPMDHIPGGNVKTIVKCCRIKEGHRIDGNTAKVPWGATVPEVVNAINDLFSE
ncbi:MAG: hypothetical protein LBH69_00370 [Methanomassiliicoccaceae archaeon]|jgi:hypothetical protein|nr:hypothetical protein [Methanomassiliicoccaceae archaeon]